MPEARKCSLLARFGSLNAADISPLPRSQTSRRATARTLIATMPSSEPVHGRFVEPGQIHTRDRLPSVPTLLPDQSREGGLVRLHLLRCRTADALECECSPPLRLIHHASEGAISDGDRQSAADLNCRSQGLSPCRFPPGRRRSASPPERGQDDQAASSDGGAAGGLWIPRGGLPKKPVVTGRAHLLPDNE